MAVKRRKMKAKQITTGLDVSRIQQKLPAFFISWTFKGVKYYRFEALRMTIENIKQGLIKSPELYTSYYGG